MPPRPIERRFHEHYSPEPNTGCWLWTGKLDRAGYGVITHDFREMRAHRVSWWLEYSKDLPSDVFVCHRCDVRCCVNPAHLFLGTAADNSHDCWRKGRGIPGARLANGSRTARLTPGDVRAIREIAASGVPYSDIASQFSVGSNYVGMIVRRVSWGHLE